MQADSSRPSGRWSQTWPALLFQIRSKALSPDTAAELEAPLPSTTSSGRWLRIGTRVGEQTWIQIRMEVELHYLEDLSHVRDVVRPAHPLQG